MFSATKSFGFKNKSSGYRLYKILVTNTLLPNGELTAIKITVIYKIRSLSFAERLLMQG